MAIDCVQLQRDIRNKIHKEFKGYTLEEQVKILSERVHNDPAWSRYFSKDKKLKKAA